MSIKDKIIDTAKGWVGRYFKRGEPAQCANFVRHVYAQHDIDPGYAVKPSDYDFMPGMPLSPSFANSFAGIEIGPKVSRKDVKGGDIVIFRNTYGDFPAGVQTHVGIAVSPIEMVDRPTADAPVKMRPIDTFVLAEARRPRVYNEEVDGTRTFKHFNHDDVDESFVDKDKLPVTWLLAQADPKGEAVFTLNGRQRDVVSIQIVVKFKEKVGA